MMMVDREKAPLRTSREYNSYNRIVIQFNGRPLVGLDRVLLQLQDNRAHPGHVPTRLRGLWVKVTQLGDPLPFGARLDGIGLCHKLLLGVPIQRHRGWETRLAGSLGSAEALNGLHDKDSARQ